MTNGLEGRCATNCATPALVGAGGLEPPASRSQTARSNLTELRPDGDTSIAQILGQSKARSSLGLDQSAGQYAADNGQVFCGQVVRGRAVKENTGRSAKLLIGQVEHGCQP